jgi:LysR family hydrogen peroxide-inducible transcriptional activator
MSEALPTLKQLRHLLAIADHGHFGRAAAACHVTQSSLSASLRELEAVLQTRLVERSTRQVRLTALGLETANRARDIIAAVTALATQASSQAPPLTGIVRLGVIPTIGPYVLPKLLPRLRKAYPNLQLYLQEDLTDRLLQDLDTGKLDMLLLALPYPMPGTASLTVGEDALLLCCPPQHPLALTKDLTISRLRQEPLLLLADGHCLREHALEACKLHHRSQPDSFAATSLYTLVQMTANGLGATLVPEMAVKAGLTKTLPVTLRTFTGKAPKRQIGLAWRKSAQRQPEAELLAAELKTCWS